MNNDNNKVNKKDNYTIDSLSKNRRKEYKPVPLLDGIEEIKNDIQDRIKQGDVTYGIEILDDNVETIRKGSITFIIAPPNTGKSNLGLKIAANLARQGKLVLICSCEMGAGLLMERELRTLLGVSMKELKTAYEFDSISADKILNTIFEDENYRYLQNINICETGGATVFDIIDMLDSCPEYDYIILDYIQRVRGAGTDYENVTEAAREFQTFARRKNKALIVCSQASRQSAIDSQGNKKDGIDPTKIRGKGSGSIEEDGDVGISLMENIINDEKFIYMTLFKNRYGSVKNVTYKYKMDSRLNYHYIGRA